MFNDPNALTVRLDDLEGAIVAIKKLAAGASVTRTMPDGRVVTRNPLLAEVLVFDGENASRETTLVFPESLQRTIEQTPDYVVGILSLDPHPKTDGHTLWQIHPVTDEAKRTAAVSAFEAITS